ncbi:MULTISPECIES: hypothetical protein [unclassified Streptomyces]|uniref:hypothetical protein n=1 Tax=unclassified Streptomyces TaxID=2593676 RepID=UPI000DAF3FB0|nr:MULTISPECIES: hypothetical protein [unclassified Streptomyces]PZT71752.1 hypothetical protein DNK55_31965 [Streptomyces sp. AC1-42T]PZT73123.1 hypothetical protein DNK56_33110 [Streptomyces sp. AC1-42W]
MSRDSGNLNFGQRVVGGLIGAISNTHSNVMGSNHVVGRVEINMRELLNRIRELRADMQRLVTTGRTDALDNELAEVEDEISATGDASQRSLARLRQALDDTPEVHPLASAMAVAEALGSV